MSGAINSSKTVDYSQAGKRLDQIAVELFPEYSRSRLQAWIKQGNLVVDGAALKPSSKLQGGELLRIVATVEVVDRLQAQAMDLDVIYADEAILVLNKPAGLVVHPAPGNPANTLLNGLLHYDDRLSQLPRAGIVHRLDKDTTGVMVVARTLTAHKNLVAALQLRQVKREYEVVVHGVISTAGQVDAPIGRHPRDRKRMAVVAAGKPALSHYSVLRRFAVLSHLRVRLETGRTHQIRVHMSYLGHPLVGDPVYGRRGKLPKQVPLAVREAVGEFPRQALHARLLAFTHPLSGEALSFAAPRPDDLQNLLTQLVQDEESAQGS